MKKRVLCILFAFLFVCISALSLAQIARAAGDFDGDYDFGGGDIGGGDYDGGFDSGDSDYNGGGNGGCVVVPIGGGDSGGSSGFPLGLIIFIIIIVVVVILAKRKQGAAHQTPVAAGGQAVDASLLKPMQEYLQLDPTFSESEFKEKLSNLFIQFQNGWQDKNLESLRPYFSDAFYAQMDRQLDAYRKNNRTKYIERIAVLGVTLSGWMQESGKDVIIARLNTRFTTYTLDDKTGNLLNGSRTAEKFLDYEWQLMRTSGKTTVGGTGVKVQNCPNCGATININHTAKCEFCGSIVTVDSYDWVLNNVKAISQRTVG